MCLSVEQLLAGAKFLFAEFEKVGETCYVDAAIVLGRQALHLSCTSGNLQQLFTSLSQLSVHLKARCRRLCRLKDLEDAIVISRYALTLCPPGHPERPLSLDHLAMGLYTRYQQLGRIEDLNEGIVLSRDALSLCSHGHPRQSAFLNNLAVHLCVRYERLGEPKDLDEAILLERGALALCRPGHPGRWLHLNNLAFQLFTRHTRFARTGDVDEAIVLDRDALELCPSGHSQRSRSLITLSSHLSIRYKQLGKVEDIEEATILAREALVLCLPGHPSRPTSLNNLATVLAIRYGRHGGIENLHEAIMLNREALALCQQQHRSIASNNLASNLLTRYEQLGDENDLNEAILLSRDALVLSPPGHPERWMVLCNLASHLYTRYNQLKGARDLNEAIGYDRDALALCLPGHLYRSSALNNLASHLFAHYQQLGDLTSIRESVFLAREALELHPLSHLQRSAALNNLAMYLSALYDLLGKIEDLEEAIVLSRDALALCPPGHPHRATSLNNVAIHLSTRYKQLGGAEDLEEAIVLSQAALTLYMPGHPNWAMTLSNLAALLSARYKQFSQVDDIEGAFNLYAQLQDASQSVSPYGLSAAKAWIDAAEEFQHPTALLAYRTALRTLVQHLAVFPPLPQHRAVLKALSSSLAVDAFSACLRNKSPANAVELLEQGRCVFWSQLSRLRSPVDDVISSGSEGKALADGFMHLTVSIRNALHSSDGDQHDRVCHLNLELKRVVSSIRALPGLSCFLLPAPFSDLRRAADSGPIIIVNASEYGCDALVVSTEHDPVHIPLSTTKEGVRELSTKLHSLTVRAKRSDITRDLGLILRNLWDQVVSPIVDFLLTAYPPQSRIWWCPTAEFTHLPLHAAGPYRKSQQNLADLYISSYTPTLSALIRARQSPLSNTANEQKFFLGVGQAKPSGECELLSVGTELADIGRCIDSLTIFTCIEGSESCTSRVTKEMGKNQWVHFACHGLPNGKNPFVSAFALHDGHFTIQHIIQCELTDPEFAYLSACHTTVGDAENPDEVIHLASAMQFAGFRSVIGTMWAVDDAETNKITSVFYKHMADPSGHLDHTRAAFALWKTMRSVKVPLDQRILYIHLGV